MNNELSPAQCAKLQRWLPEVVTLKKNGGYLIHKGNTREVLNTELDYLCRMAEAKLTEVEQINYVAVLWKNNQPEGFKGGYEWNQAALSQLIWWTLTHATPSQRINALPIKTDTQNNHEKRTRNNQRTHGESGSESNTSPAD